MRNVRLWFVSDIPLGNSRKGDLFIEERPGGRDYGKLFIRVTNEHTGRTWGDAWHQIARLTPAQIERLRNGR